MTSAPFDPGWRGARRQALWVFLSLLPGGFLLNRIGRRRVDEDGLTQLRGLFSAFGSALVGMGFVVVLVDRAGDTGGTLPAVQVAALVAVIGIALQVLGAIVERDLDCRDLGTLVSGYRTRFFLRLAYSEGAALLGFVGFMVTSAPAVYGVGLLVSAVGFVRTAPTEGRLAAEQQALALRGCPHDLVAALRGMAPDDLVAGS